MAGKLKINKIQVGDSGTSANNFLISSDGAGGFNRRFKRGRQWGGFRC
jgi:hypothetical protein